MIKYKVPFYSNTSDNTHCYQAALRSILKYFIPEKEYSWKELEKMTAKKEGLWTWPTQALINLHKMGFEIIDIDNFDFKEFFNIPEAYLIKKYGKEVAAAQIKNSDIKQERVLAREYLEYSIHQNKMPEFNDIKKLLSKGYLVGCNVNSKALNNKKGYSGHFIVAIGYDDSSLYIHDPGLPPRPERIVSYKQFSKAWEYPNKNSRNLTGFKYNNKK